MRAVSTVTDKSVKSLKFAYEKCADLKKFMPLLNWSQIIFISLLPINTTINTNRTHVGAWIPRE